MTERCGFIKASVNPQCKLMATAVFLLCVSPQKAEMTRPETAVATFQLSMHIIAG